MVFKFRIQLRFEL